MLSEKFKNLISDNKNIFESKLLVGVSGGVDSIVLCDLLYNNNICFSIVHCNFSLRGKESDEDELFVKNIAEKYKVQIFNIKVQPPKNNIQIWAREFRYKWFEEIRKNNGFSKILVAHHLDDNLETFLINFIRGTGLEGLTGMDFSSDTNTVRPLLNFSRNDILEYAKINSLLWREDSSNMKKKYLRNRLRHDIVPIFKDLNTNFLSSFEKTIKNLNLVNNFYLEKINENINNIKENYQDAIFCININKLIETNNQELFLYEILKDYGFSNMLEDIIKSFSKSSVNEFYNKKYRLLKYRDRLILTEKKIDKTYNNQYLIYENTTCIDTPVKIEFNKIDNQDIDYLKENMYFDYHKLKFPLVIRKFKEGDYFYPFGMKGGKKLSKFFKDEKISNIEKENTWVLVDEKNILGVIGKRQSNIYKIDKETKKVYICQCFKIN